MTGFAEVLSTMEGMQDIKPIGQIYKILLSLYQGKISRDSAISYISLVSNTSKRTSVEFFEKYGIQ